jgi:hypothetical protein
MADSVAESDIHAFYDFLGKRIQDASAPTPEESVQEFRAHQAQLRRAQAELRESHAEYLAGRAQPLHVDSLVARVRARMAGEGASD